MKIIPLHGQHGYECAVFDLVRMKHSVVVGGGICLDRHETFVPAICAGYVGIVGDQPMMPSFSGQLSQQSQQFSANQMVEVTHVQ